MTLRATSTGLSAVACLVWLSLVAISAEPPAGPGSASANDPLSIALVEAHNHERAKEKKPLLTFNARLAAAAGVQARDMAEHDKMSHEGSDGSTPAQRIERQDYHGRRIGENVAEGQETVDGVMRGWMNSPPHRENILGDFSEIGVARALAEDGTPYWCVDFGLSWPKLDPAAASAQVVEAINRVRKKAEKPPLASDPTLLAAANEEARRMASREGLDAKQDEDKADNPLKRIIETDRRFRKLGELAASGLGTPDEVVRGWLDASDQRASLLDEEFNRIGVGYATAAKGTPYWVVILGRSIQ